MRHEGWEARLHAVVDDARRRPYVLGEHDCFRVACRVIEALTGRNLWPQFCGYTTRREALQALAGYGSSFEAAFDVVLGLPRIDLKQAGRGDLVAYAEPHDEKHLGVVIDHRVALLMTDGLQFIPKTFCFTAWRVG